MAFELVWGNCAGQSQGLNSAIESTTFKVVYLSRFPFTLAISISYYISEHVLMFALKSPRCHGTLQGCLPEPIKCLTSGNLREQLGNSHSKDPVLSVLVDLHDEWTLQTFFVLIKLISIHPMRPFPAQVVDHQPLRGLGRVRKPSK